MMLRLQCNHNGSGFPIQAIEAIANTEPAKWQVLSVANAAAAAT